MMIRRLWVPVFLVLTAGALGMELWAGLDSSPSTVPWTDLVSTYVPQPVTVTALTVLAAWLPVHFAHHYASEGKPVKKYSKSIVAVLTAGGVALGSALSDDKVTNAEWVVIGLAALGALGVYAVSNTTTVTRPADGSVRRAP